MTNLERFNGEAVRVNPSEVVISTNPARLISGRNGIADSYSSPNADNEMNDKSKDESFLARWLSGELSPEEQAEFNAREDADLLRKIAEASADLQLPKRDRAASWNALQQQVEKEKQPARVRQLGRWWQYAAAAVVLLFAGYFFLLPSGDEWTTVSAPLAQKMVYELPDGSEVWLNAGSEMRFQEQQFSEVRWVELEGEGFFDVVPGASFEVNTPQGLVSVLGTSFDVYARAEQFRVACYTGRVGVRYSDTAPQEILEPGQGVAVIDQEVSRQTFDEEENMPKWTSGYSRFTEADFKTVIEELERQYALEINYPASLDTIQDYNGGFPHRDLETALEIVFSSVGHQVRVEGSTVEVLPSSE